jgi:hypothetical protein
MHHQRCDALIVATAAGIDSAALITGMFCAGTAGRLIRSLSNDVDDREGTQTLTEL